MNTVDELFQKGDDELIDGLFDHVMGGGFNPSTATEQEKALIYLVTAYGILGNGGFRYFFESDFENSVSHQEIISYFIKIGSIATADLLSEVIKLFPNSVIPTDLENRSVLLDKLENSKQVEDMEKKLFESMKSDMANLAKYLRDNQHEFSN